MGFDPIAAALQPGLQSHRKGDFKLESVLRKLAERTLAGLVAILEGCADLFAPAEYVNYFNACGC